MVMTIQIKREALGMTQTQLGAALGVAQNVISNWETEVALPKARQLPQLARVLGVTIDELFVPIEDVS